MSLLILLLRFYVRGCMIKAIGADCFLRVRCGDDYTYAILPARPFDTTTNPAPKETKWGLGLTHLEDMPTEDIYNFGLIQYIGAPFYITSILGFKLSLLLSYLRFMPKGAARNTTIMLIVACILFHISFLVVQVNLCQPISKQWNPAITDGQCLQAVPFYLSMASLTIFFDVAVMVLPFPVLLKSRIQKRKKVALLGLLALGIFITVIQILRIQTVRNLSNYLDSSSLIMWSTIENNLGIIVASIPTLAPLFKYFVEKTQKSSSGNSGNRSRTVYTAKSKRSMRHQSIRLDSVARAASRLSTTFDMGESREHILDQAARTSSKDVEAILSTRNHQVFSQGRYYANL
ncbi:integral membrane protein [Pyrenophora tritici-repentis]|nr:hypothetical protein Alg215_11217 [Pyrenophora tritici-repentis]KAI0585180.1 hypothetical protein Alg130_04879 [Pyrenophora tritici-repentis]KAI0605200.1 hypothetical protein TUN205_10551 [Pyrenophora tritici-repentis]KAI0623091.1 hypothetical protein TUN199_04933 [Pyrenophora tritici-repentis]KAI1513388.1 hypothetical protein Ptr86124_007290 [Pyrenophora tritici-repentis]